MQPASEGQNEAGQREEHLRSYLANFDQACPGCRYSLRGLTGMRCPECNQELKLQVGLVEPRLGAFIAGVAGVGMSLGFCGLLLLWVVLMTMRFRGGPPRKDLIPLAIGAVVAGVVLWAWLRVRPRLSKMEPSQKWVWALMVWGVSLLCPLWFMLTVR